MPIDLAREHSSEHTVATSDIIFSSHPLGYNCYQGERPHPCNFGGFTEF